MGNAESGGENVSDSAWYESIKGMVCRSVYFLTQQYIEEIEESGLNFSFT